ncbi:mitochondrial inner membrane protease ATP23 homolog isoform X5 [Phymastichus coffea]|uniref:mitochondrial inner membrane protease ATP23 homolog isoform X5 n=1 Tax=Phymastichus coffea TaxID=108790 RepID=UPI00273C977A|nr:mitochondrial inner membrane protease ATP23 homolog isoform X5 [Phymastichus coffea]
MTGDLDKKGIDENEITWLYNDLYPERRGLSPKRNWLRMLFGLEGKEELDKIKCERNVYWCLRNSPLVKLLLSALNASGCEFDFRRHISCEICDAKVSGGYDQELNQNCVKAKALTSILAVKEISENQALAAIDEVFPKCYADLEPIGRRCRRNSNNMEMALLEAPLYGYDYYI